MKVHILVEDKPRCNRPVTWNTQATNDEKEVTCQTCKDLIKLDNTGVHYSQGKRSEKRR